VGGGKSAKAKANELELKSGPQRLNFASSSGSGGSNLIANDFRLRTPPKMNNATFAPRTKGAG